MHSEFQCPSFMEITGVGGMPLSIVPNYTTLSEIIHAFHFVHSQDQSDGETNR